MKKGYVYEVGTAIALLAVIEAYLWTQSRTYFMGNLATKAFLIGLYGVLAVVSQALVSSTAGFGMPDGLKTNVLVAAAISVGLTLLGFFLHPGLLKDMPRNWLGAASATLRFFVTIGLGTAAVRILVATAWARRNKDGA